VTAGSQVSRHPPVVSIFPRRDPCGAATLPRGGPISFRRPLCIYAPVEQRDWLVGDTSAEGCPNPTADLCSECRVGEQAAFRAAPLVSATGKSGRRHNDKGMRGRRPALAGASELAS
jgi:hypothetical protein